MNKFISIERVVWLIVLAAGVYGTITVTNYMRDHNVYRQSAAECGADKSTLRQEIDRLNSDINLQEDKVSELKSLPVN